MSTLKLRLKNLEDKLVKPVFPLIIVCGDDNPTIEQQELIRQAKQEGRAVKIIRTVVVGD